MAGAAACDASSGTSPRVSNTIGITVAVISITTTPATTGVKMRRSSESLDAIANWNSDDTTTRLAIVDGPPSISAATQTAMNAPDVPMIRTCPAPTRPTRTAWTMVVTPLTSIAAKTAQDRYESDCSAIRATMTTVSTTEGTVTMAACAPTPAATSRGGRSSAS